MQLHHSGLRLHRHVTSFHCRTSHVGLRARPTLAAPCLKFLHLQRSCFPIKAHSAILGIRTATYLFGGTKFKPYTHYPIYLFIFLLELLFLLSLSLPQEYKLREAFTFCNFCSQTNPKGLEEYSTAGRHTISIFLTDSGHHHTDVLFISISQLPWLYLSSY